ncbi:ABC transporter ATP-binding protein [Paenibacillus aceris]|uniref:Peptide/nickel transport system ATP-binding protein/oligopeptide transport system ATP-binding protein n=1 Tax=Paenibacillus aceris TaxID=869555 RepID=A0ABS4I2F0_9BACL|nr:dipeptide ABC transporter ATP-binding protein [Paenibacillus aceris]MBP1964988.1 peptide/nickel transport system ATP-binding protein/oligopeptide transport system ATP-binding protein [Paenibacillus aceris]NHW35648.1 dipeptide ABC transporter ATP-binding protein [Paenibacillus aceris]
MLTKLTEQIDPMLVVKGLKKYFPVKGALGQSTGEVKAVNNVSFQLYEGETFGLVGESGCGKSTLGRTILRLTEPTNGEAIYQNKNIFHLSGMELRNIRQEMQMVFQDPYSSLNPRKRIGSMLEEPLTIHQIGLRQERTERVMEILHKVGLQPDHYYRYPHEFSGGQRQRIGLARALVVNPKLVICDEPVSALDVSIQSQIINLFQQLQDELKLTYLFVAHDLSVVRHISDRIGVMYLGQMVEQAPTDSLFSSPLHPYTQALLSAVPIPNPNVKKERIILKGEIPSPLNPPRGCIFHTRCPFVMDICRKEIPLEKEMSRNHFVSCHLH